MKKSMWALLGLLSLNSVWGSEAQRDDSEAIKAMFRGAYMGCNFVHHRLIESEYQNHKAIITLYDHEILKPIVGRSIRHLFFKKIHEPNDLKVIAHLLNHAPYLFKITLDFRKFEIDKNGASLKSFMKQLENIKKDFQIVFKVAVRCDTMPALKVKFTELKELKASDPLRGYLDEIVYKKILKIAMGLDTILQRLKLSDLVDFCHPEQPHMNGVSCRIPSELEDELNKIYYVDLRFSNVYYFKYYNQFDISLSSLKTMHKNNTLKFKN